MFEDIEFFAKRNEVLKGYTLVGFTFWYKDKKYGWSACNRTEYIGFTQIHLVYQLFKIMKKILR